MYFFTHWLPLALFASTSLTGVTNAVPISDNGGVTIPGPPADPPKPPGDGQGVWGRENPGIGDRLDKVKYSNLLKVVPSSYGHAATNLRHYLDNTGTTFANKPEDIMNDIPAFKAAVLETTKHYASAAFSSVDSGAGGIKAFSSGWLGFYATPELDKDWYYALGGFAYAVAGTVKTRKVGSAWVADLAYKVYIFDRYNWDGDKNTKILWFTVTDKEMGHLHVVGLAREYIVRGSSGVFSVPAWNGKAASLPPPTTGGRS